MIDCRVSDTTLEPGELSRRVEDGAAGAIAVFVGTVRNSSATHSGHHVNRLEYEAYTPMAEREMRKIAEEAAAAHGTLHVVAHHRVGVLEIGEPAVVVAVSTPHRAAAFDACRYIIEELKRRVPIWKKEVFSDGSEWVNARP